MKWKIIKAEVKVQIHIYCFTGIWTNYLQSCINILEDANINKALSDNIFKIRIR